LPKLAERIETPRMQLRVPEATDAGELNAAVAASFTELTAWMPWANSPQTLEETQQFCEDSRSGWMRDDRFNLLMVTRSNGKIIGGTGFPRLDWEVPSFEIGYWCHSDHVGQGYVAEATYALATYAFTELSAARVELRMDTRSERSWRVAERLGFVLEGVLRSDTRDPSGQLRDTRVYAAVKLEDLLPADR